MLYNFSAISALFPGSKDEGRRVMFKIICTTASLSFRFQINEAHSERSREIANSKRLGGHVLPDPSPELPLQCISTLPRRSATVWNGNVFVTSRVAIPLIHQYTATG